jgi:outer membrane protein assembly factor BamB
MTIDLGVLERERPDDRRQPGHWAGWWRWRRTPVRRWGQGALAVLLSLPLAAATPLPPPGLVPVWTHAMLSLSGTAPLPRPVPDGPHLYAVAPTAAGPALVAYRLADGSVAWRAPVAGDVAAVRVAAGVPVVTTAGPHATAYDPATGRVLWRRAGVPWQEVGGSLLVVGEPTGDPFRLVTAVDPATGRALWRRAGVPWREVGGSLLVVAVPAGSGHLRVVTAVDPRTGDALGVVTGQADPAVSPWQAPDGSLHLFTLNRDGGLARHPMAGGPVRSVDTAHEQRQGEPRDDSLGVVDDLVVVTDRTGPLRAVAAYDPVTLRHRWTLPGGYGASPCGPVVCVRVVDPDAGPYPSVRGVDPRSGATRWSASCADADLSGGSCTMSVRGLGQGRLWMEMVVPDRYTQGSRVTSWVADATTGEPLTDGLAWSLRERHGGSALLLSQGDRERAPGTPARPRRWWWARAGAGPEVEVLGSVDATTCVPHDPYLVCWTDREGVTVWRIDR